MIGNDAPAMDRAAGPAGNRPTVNSPAAGRHRPFALGLCAGAALVLMAGCSGKDEAQGERHQAGDVLKGTVSDAMIPLEALRSHSPPLEPEVLSGSAGSDGAGAQAPAGETLPAGDASSANQAAADEPSAAQGSGESEE